MMTRVTGLCQPPTLCALFATFCNEYLQPSCHLLRIRVAVTRVSCLRRFYLTLKADSTCCTRGVLFVDEYVALCMEGAPRRNIQITYSECII